MPRLKSLLFKLDRSVMGRWNEALIEDNDEFFEALENAPMRPPREILARRGFEAAPVEGLQGAELRGRLWELIYALAAERFFFHDIDHLDDREFYNWLVEDWLESPIDDVPPECETNCHSSPDVGGGNDEGDDPDTIWLRYYADPESRELFAEIDPNEPLTPHVAPPHDRDRFLPYPYPRVPLEIDDEAMMEGGDDESDPLGLRKVDREIARESSKKKTRSAQSIKWERPAETLRRAGFSPMPPQEITPESQAALLWELLHELSIVGFYVLYTNHLTDAELYAALWRRGIRDDAMLPGRSKTAAWFHDMLGSGSDEDTALYLRFHADDAARADHAERYPDEALPPREKPVADRDWRLPKAVGFGH